MIGKERELGENDRSIFIFILIYGETETTHESFSLSKETRSITNVVTFTLKVEVRLL